MTRPWSEIRRAKGAPEDPSAGAAVVEAALNGWQPCTCDWLGNVLPTQTCHRCGRGARLYRDAVVHDAEGHHWHRECADIADAVAAERRRLAAAVSDLPPQVGAEAMRAAVLEVLR